ncbi:unnamed protein product [Alternaria alternata]
MQRDDRVPLKEIYDTPEALHEQVERIIDLALYEESYDTPLRLRYVTPVSREQWLANDNYNEYRLTPLDEHQHDMDYVTVSYCWKHTQSLQDLPPIPQYLISKSSEDTPYVVQQNMGISRETVRLDLVPSGPDRGIYQAAAKFAPSYDRYRFMF